MKRHTFFNAAKINKSAPGGMPDDDEMSPATDDDETSPDTDDDDEMSPDTDDNEDVGYRRRRRLRILTMVGRRRVPTMDMKV